MKTISIEETMTRRMHVRGIAAVVISFIAVLLGIIGYIQWFYALGLLSLSFLFACLVYSARKESWANIFHMLKMVFGILFVFFVGAQLILLITQSPGG